MKKHKLYIITVVVISVVSCLIAALFSFSSKRHVTMVTNVIDASNRIRRAIIDDPNYISVVDNNLTSDPNRTYISVAPAIVYTPRNWLSSLSLPQRLDEWFTKTFPSKVNTSVDVFVYNATPEEMSQINHKLTTIKHLSEIPIDIMENGVMPSQDRFPIMLKVRGTSKTESE